MLSVGYAWALLDAGELEASETRLQDAERLLKTPADKMVVVDKEQFRSCQLRSPPPRAYRSLALGNVPGAVKYAQQALKLTPEDDRVRYIQATSLLGLAQYTSGDLESAERSLADFLTNLRKTGEIQTPIGITFLLADIRMALGRLHEAESIYQQSLSLTTGQGEPMPLGTADLYAASVSSSSNGGPGSRRTTVADRPEIGRADRADGLAASPLRSPRRV